MSPRKKIACFITGGFTEVNSMKWFLKKVNANLDFIQLCPVSLRKNRDSIRNRVNTSLNNGVSTSRGPNGLTGASLVNYVVEYITDPKYSFSPSEYAAILIEDDKDSRFLAIQDDGSSKIDISAWNKYEEEVSEKIGRIVPDIPVILLLAAPEVEAWFIADWDNSFAKAFKAVSGLTTEENTLFSTRFRRYINDTLLTERYRYSIEEYGYFDGMYRKLIEEIQNALDVNDFLKDRTPHKEIRYTKTNHGEEMLREIEPQSVRRGCTTCFRKVYDMLSNME